MDGRNIYRIFIRKEYIRYTWGRTDDYEYSNPGSDRGWFSTNVSQSRHFSFQPSVLSESVQPERMRINCPCMPSVVTPFPYHSPSPGTIKYDLPPAPITIVSYVSVCPWHWKLEQAKIPNKRTVWFVVWMTFFANISINNGGTLNIIAEMDVGHCPMSISAEFWSVPPLVWWKKCIFQLAFYHLPLR